MIMSVKSLQIERRAFVAALAALGMGAAPRPPAPATELETANLKLVNEFCAAFALHDLEKIMSCFSETGSYRALETSPIVKGRDAVRMRIGGYLPRVERFEVLDSFARGPMVINERYDHFTVPTIKRWHGVGVFFIKDGKIEEWSDYTTENTR